MRCASAAAAKAERLHSNLFLSRPPSLDTPRTALVLLNTPPRPAAALRRLWSLSAFRVCADAAANRLRDSIQLVMQDEAGVSGGPAALRRRLLELQRVAREHELMVPDVVTGDFDSIREDVLEFYRGRGCRIAHNSSQDSTDFEKALDIVAEAQNAGAPLLRKPRSAATAAAAPAGSLARSWAPAVDGCGVWRVRQPLRPRASEHERSVQVPP